MLTATQMIQAVGQDCLIRTDIGAVLCTVRDVRNRFGTADVQITPVNPPGLGEGARVWVALSRVVCVYDHRKNADGEPRLNLVA